VSSRRNYRQQGDDVKRFVEKLAAKLGSGDAAAADEAASREPAHRLLFVCMGNICRSPTAEGVFRHLAANHAPDLAVHVDSAGTHAYHLGEPPDPRAQRAAERRGISLAGLKARRVRDEDFASFDLIIAMDELNLEMLREQCPQELRVRLKLLLDYAPQLGRRDVPDPYYGGGNGFEYVLDLVEEASRGLLEHLKAMPRE
jgi:protein-tyrosine phosphatase